MHIPMTEIDDDEVVQDGEAVTVPFFLRDGETLPQLRERIAQSQTLDAYQVFLQDRSAQRQKQFDELQAIADGTATRAFAAALVKRDDAWLKRGAGQEKEWQRRPAPPPTSEAHAQAKPQLQMDAALKDVTAARDAAWAKRGEQLANAWRR